MEELRYWYKGKMHYCTIHDKIPKKAIIMRKLDDDFSINGEIYEGDIIERRIVDFDCETDENNRVSTFIVKFDKHYGFYLDTIRDDLNINEDDIVEILKTNSFTVLGNVFENKRVLDINTIDDDMLLYSFKEIENKRIEEEHKNYKEFKNTYDDIIYSNNASTFEDLMNKAIKDKVIFDSTNIYGLEMKKLKGLKIYNSTWTSNNIEEYNTCEFKNCMIARLDMKKVKNCIFENCVFRNCKIGDDIQYTKFINCDMNKKYNDYTGIFGDIVHSIAIYKISDNI